MEGIPELYEPLIERDLPAIPAVARSFADRESPESLVEAVIRFSVLSYSPSLHSKHAVLAALAVHDLRAKLGEGLVDAAIAAAVYAASSRRPWSEPPLGDPPAIEPGHPADLSEIRIAAEQGDRIRGEKWLAALLGQPGPPGAYLHAAVSLLSVEKETLLLSVAAWRIAEMFRGRGTFAVLRIGPLEWTASPSTGSHVVADSESITVLPALQRLVRRYCTSGGDIAILHAIELIDAALIAADAARDDGLTGIPLTVAEAMVPEVGDEGPPLTAAEPADPVYDYARDCAGYLEAKAMTERLAMKFPDVDFEPMLGAARYNLQHGPSMTDWILA